MDELEKIWNKYLMKNATKEERAQLLEFLNDETKKQQIEAFMDKTWIDTSKKEADMNPKSSVLANIKSEIKKEQSIPKQSNIFKLQLVYQWVAAASIIGIMALGGWLLLQQPTGKVFEKILAVNTGEYARQFELPDGSMVWLNAASKLEYAKNFQENRQLYLEGEAYFEVKKDSLHPFEVLAGKVKTTVLGTEFNVNAYPDFEEVKVSLEEGKVLVSKQDVNSSFQQMLSPKEELTFNKPAETYSTGIFVQDNPYIWTEDIILFDGDDIQRVIKILEKHYKVTFEIEATSLRKIELVHRIDKKKFTLKQALAQISKLTGYRFVWKTKRKIKVLP